MDPDFDITFTAAFNCGNFTICQTTADHKGQNIAILLVKLLQGIKHLPGFFPDNVQALLVACRFRGWFLKGRKLGLSAYMIIETIPAYGEKQGNA